jgi:hypothetical protein
MEGLDSSTASFYEAAGDYAMHEQSSSCGQHHVSEAECLSHVLEIRLSDRHGVTGEEPLNH